jgi:hypothetical protein
MSLVATVADPLTDPAPPAWDAFVTRHRLPALWRWQVLAPADWCAVGTPSMVLVRERSGDEPVALFHARRVGPGGLGSYGRPGRRPWLGLTVCQLNSSLAPGLAFADGLDRRDRAEACRAFERAARRPGLAYRGLADGDLAVVPSAARVRLRLSPVMVLTNRWPDLASYLAGLPRKWRSQLRGIHDGLRADPHLRVEIASSIEPEEACWLAELVVRRYASRPAPPRPVSYFRQLAALPESRFLTYRTEHGRLLSFVCFLDDGRELVLVWWGTRHRRDGWRPNIYFDQYLRLVELMVASGRHRMVLGCGREDVKARYGAWPQPRWALVRPW